SPKGARMTKSQFRRSTILQAAALAALSASATHGQVTYQTIQNYDPFIFNYQPGDLKTVTAWYGERIALIIDNETNPAARDQAAMTRIVQTLDNIIYAYEDVIGRAPPL